MLEQLVTSLLSSTTLKQVVNKPLTTCQQAGNKQCEHIPLTSCWNSITSLQVCCSLVQLVRFYVCTPLIDICHQIQHTIYHEMMKIFHLFFHVRSLLYRCVYMDNDFRFISTRVKQI